MYPGLATVLKKSWEYCFFICICPHALSEREVEDLVEIWSRVVVYFGDSEQRQPQRVEELQHLGPPNTYKVL